MRFFQDITVIPGELGSGNPDWDGWLIAGSTCSDNNSKLQTTRDNGRPHNASHSGIRSMLVGWLIDGPSCTDNNSKLHTTQR